MGGPTWNFGGGLTYPCHGTGRGIAPWSWKGGFLLLFLRSTLLLNRNKHIGNDFLFFMFLPPPSTRWYPHRLFRRLWWSFSNWKKRSCILEKCVWKRLESSLVTMWEVLWQDNQQHIEARAVARAEHRCERIHASENFSVKRWFSKAPQRHWALLVCSGQGTDALCEEHFVTLQFTPLYSAGHHKNVQKLIPKERSQS